MTLEEVFSGINQVFLDTAPIIYFVEEHPCFFPTVNLIFEHIEAGVLTGVTSPVTLAECLVIPYRDQNISLQQEFIALITQTENIDFYIMTQWIGEKAGMLRAQYNIQLLDALQVATALAANCQAFLTNDIQLKRVQDLKILIIEELMQCISPG